MSPVDPPHDLSEQGASDDPRYDPARGTAEVRSRITGGGRGDDALSSTRDRLDDLRERASAIGDKAGEWASRARREVDDRLHQVEERLDLEESAISNAIRANPVLAAGLAFGIGFLLAGSRRPSSGILGAATGQLRGAVIGGLTATISHELRELVEEHGGVGALLSSLTGSEHPAESPTD